MLASKSISGGGASKNASDPSNIQRNRLLKEYTKNEKVLKAELQQLELARKQYEHSCKNEIQKVIIRYTNRIAKHHFFVDNNRNVLNNSASNSNDSFSSNSTGSRIGGGGSGFDFENLLAQSSLINSRISTASRRESVRSNMSMESTAARVAHSAAASKHQQQQIGLVLPKLKNNNNIATAPTTSQAITAVAATNNLNQNDSKSAKSNNRAKKNVSFNTASLKQQQEQKTTTTTAIDNEDDDDFIDYHKRPSKGFSTAAAALVAASRLSTASTTTRKSVDSSRAKDPAAESINHFLNSLKNTDSGFYSYVNAKGEAMCAGYDNFANLNRFNSASSISTRTSFSQSKSQPSPPSPANYQYASSGGKKTAIKISHFDNPFELIDIKKPRKKTYDDEEFVKSSLLFTADSLLFNSNQKKNSIGSNSSSNSNSVELSEADSDENKKLFDKLVKASNTRSLTMKNILV